MLRKVDHIARAVFVSIVGGVGDWCWSIPDLQSTILSIHPRSTFCWSRGWGIGNQHQSALDLQSTIFVNQSQICILLIQGRGRSSTSICPASTINNFVNPPQIHILSIKAISTINMERINNQHFTVHLNCSLLIIDRGGQNLAAPTISVWSTRLIRVSYCKVDSPGSNSTHPHCTCILNILTVKTFAELICFGGNFE